MYPNLHTEPADQPTEKEIEHRIHRVEGKYFQWCESCVEEEICPACKGSGFFEGKECEMCESSGRKI